MAVDLLAGVQYCLNTATDPHDTGRHNLEAVQARARHIATIAAQALVDERGT